MLFGNNGYKEETEMVQEGVVPEIMTDEDETLIFESYICDNNTSEDIDAFLENATAVAEAVNAEVVMEKSIVRLDKKAKFNQAYWTAIFSVAREKKDPKFKKLVTLWKLEAKLEKYLENKYGSEAKRRAAVAIRNRKSKLNKTKVASKAIKETKKIIK